MKHYDLIALGSGGAGFQAAMALKKDGQHVAVINEGLFGGTCSVCGCIPKKVLAGTAKIADENRRLYELGIIKNQPELDWHTLIEHKRSFTAPAPETTKQELRGAGIDIYAGSPRFTGDLQIEINGEVLEASKVVIGVGAKPTQLPIEGAEHLVLSDGFLELQDLPRDIIFVGGGYISFEFAHIAARFGATVTILHGDDRPLPMFDPDVINTLIAASKEVGIQVELNARVSKIEKSGAGVSISTEDGRTYSADIAVHGAGRQPALGSLNLEAAGIDYDAKKGVLVDEYLRSTSNPNVYAAGDAAASGPPLSPVASVQGAIVAANLLGKQQKQPGYLSVPSVIFSTPAVASVGYLESQASDANIQYEVIQTDLSGWFDAKRLNVKHAMSKILLEKESGKILGAHIIGNNAENIINIFSLAIELGLTAEQLKKPMFAFPTSSDDMRSMF